MPAMQGRRHEEAAQDSLDLERQIDVPVLAEVDERKDHLEDDHTGDRDTEHSNREEPERQREQQLTRVKPEGGGDRVVRIGVVSLVEPP